MAKNKKIFATDGDMDWSQFSGPVELTPEQLVKWLESMLAFNKEVFRCNPKIYESWRNDKGLANDPRYDHGNVFRES